MKKQECCEREGGEEVNEEGEGSNDRAENRGERENGGR